MEPGEFARRWAAEVEPGTEFVTYGRALIAGPGVGSSDLRLLVEVGLPEATAPFLSFTASPGMLASAREFQDLKQLSAMAEIGFNGSGDPICIDRDSGRVVYLNHDLEFQPVFINSTIRHFALCLLSFNSLIKQAVDARDSVVDAPFTREEADGVLAALQAVDPSCTQPDSFWAEEVTNLTV